MTAIPHSARVLRITAENARTRSPAADEHDADSPLAPEDVQALHDLADRATEHIRTLDQAPDEVVVGVYRQFGRSSRLAARVLRTLLEPVTCHILTAAAGRRPMTGPTQDDGPVGTCPEDLDLVIDASRLPHPQARSIADAAGVPLITRVPAGPSPFDAEPSGPAVARGTAAGRAVALSRGPRPAGARPGAARRDGVAPRCGRR
jgi:hypothetical protein